MNWPANAHIRTFDVCLAWPKVCPTDIVRPHAAWLMIDTSVNQFCKIWPSAFWPLTHCRAMRPDAPWKKKPALKVQCALMHPRLYDHLWLAVAGKRDSPGYKSCAQRIPRWQSFHLIPNTPCFEVRLIFFWFFWGSALEANFAVCRMDWGAFSWDDEEEVFTGFTVEEVA